MSARYRLLALDDDHSGYLVEVRYTLVGWMVWAGPAAPGAVSALVYRHPRTRARMAATVAVWWSRADAQAEAAAIARRPDGPVEVRVVPLTAALHELGAAA